MNDLDLCVSSIPEVQAPITDRIIEFAFAQEEQQPRKNNNVKGNKL